MTRKRSPAQAVGYGALAGVIASVPMAMVAMITAWEKGTGFFTPMYHIASLWASQDAMMVSMKAAMGGSAFHFVLGTAALGAVIHMMTGAMYGALFGLAASRFDVKIGMLVGAGLAYGAVVFVVSAFIGLPLAAAIFNSGDQITHMAEMAGWGVFFVEHLIYGLALGVVVAAAQRRAHPVVAPQLATHLG
ncbi:MAG: hypothetical protein HOV96_15130 [Nonomuraea sp.]|nr:hypothetical protein [Nonomuraea sp.]